MPELHRFHTHTSALRLLTLTPALLGVLAGSALQLYQSALWSVNFYMLFVLLALILYGLIASFFRASERAMAMASLLAFTMLAFAVTGLRASVFASTALSPALEGQNVVVSGVVAGLPQRFEGGVRFHFEQDSAFLKGQAVTLPHRLELAWYAGVFGQSDADGDPTGELQRTPAPVQADERWQFTVRLKAPHGGINPHGFDYELMQWEQGVQAGGYVRAGRQDPPPQRLDITWQHPVDGARQQVRERIFASVADPHAAGLIAALVTGDQGAIERADWDVFRATGVAHLMSISGLHITMFAWLAAGLVGWLWRRSQRLCLWLPAPSAALIGGVLLAAAYALFSGWGVPAQRTVLMLLTVGALRLAGVRWPWPQVWLLACAVVVALDPWALLQAGFWLSFVAVGVLFASDSGAVSQDDKRARARFVHMFREQWVITLALTPLTLLLFGQVSLVGLLANALAIPTVTLVVTPLAMLGTVLPGLWTLATWVIGLLSAVLQWLAAWPWAVWWVAQAPWWAGAVGVLGGVLLAMRLPWSLRLTGVPMLLPVLLWQVPQPPEGQFELLAADIGQGNAVLVRTRHHALQYDAGPRFSSESDAGQRVLVPLLRALGVRLDTVVLSHRDSDHVGGAPAVLMMQPQAQLISSIERDNTLQMLRPAMRCMAGQRWRWDGVDFEMLHPQAGDYEQIKKTNAMSCVLRISNGQQTALLVGDIEQLQEAQLVQALAPAVLRADVLLVPHHGSKSSSSALFLDAVQPRIALIQAGYRNRYGHPYGPVLVRYQVSGARVVDSPHCGAETWQSWDSGSVQCQRVLDLRYWHHQMADVAATP
ncbi:DNA internalization-related competence protein ComEC/Rec2 [Rhodoferax sp.]|uniref:DNA internalization-related competence protein ComEC/Rec2 n=1 Tax=Rhodoferax sp. TaxID=50421 RepID=UPI002849AF69|nr:DNA internalization-related competence protein ComEC/Rec2 [Rhodoferax sp.]MDR3368401.1 DNA internalization-related competence protein ComEC/Rec2 [Rhodoferax sp.]